MWIQWITNQNGFLLSQKVVEKFHFSFHSNETFGSSILLKCPCFHEVGSIIPVRDHSEFHRFVCIEENKHFIEETQHVQVFPFVSNFLKKHLVRIFVTIFAVDDISGLIWSVHFIFHVNLLRVEVQVTTAIFSVYLLTCCVLWQKSLDAALVIPGKKNNELEFYWQILFWQTFAHN